MEANPLAGLHPHHSDLPILSTRAGTTYPDLIDAIVRSAAVRLRPGVATAAEANTELAAHGALVGRRPGRGRAAALGAAR
jgi:hypothetical protein